MTRNVEPVYFFIADLLLLLVVETKSCLFFSFSFLSIGFLFSTGLSLSVSVKRARRVAPRSDGPFGVAVWSANRQST